MNSIMNKKSQSFGISNFILAFAGIMATMLCACFKVTDGLELLFLLPAAFTVCSFAFYRVFSYMYDNLALAIIFATIFVRYLITPVLITVSKGALSTVYPTPNYYRLAICIQVFELFAVLIIVDKIWTKYKKKMNFFVNNASEKVIDFKLSWIGFLFLVALAVIVLRRGHLNDLINRYSTWWYISKDMSAIYYYDYIAVEIIKSVIGIVLISFFAKRYRRANFPFVRAIYFILAITVSLCMTMFYMYDSRTALAQLVLSSMAVMLGFFPERKKLLITVFVGGGGAFVAYVFASGSMRYEIGGENEGFLSNLCKMSELYVSGPSMTAITQQNYDWVRQNMSIMTYVSDFVKTSHVFGMFPFLRGINNMVENIPTSNALFVESLGGLTYILPNYSLWTYYVTDIFGWLFEIASVYAVIRIICYVDKKKKNSADAFYYYALAYVEILLGQAIFVNNTFLLWHAFTNLPFWLLIFVLVNRFGNKIKIK